MTIPYKAIGINLKAVPFGESDRLLTVLTREHGLIRAIAPGSRKHQSSLRGRSGLFVINQLLIVKGKSLDKIIQMEGVESFPGLSQDLRRLTAGQYLAELVLFQALGQQPQDELFTLLNEALRQLEHASGPEVLPWLTRGTVELLSLAGIFPQVHTCCITQQPLVPDFQTPNWQVGFHAEAGGTVSLAALEQVTRPKSTATAGNSFPPRPQFPNMVENKEGRRGDRPYASEAADGSSSSAQEGRGPSAIERREEPSWPKLSEGAAAYRTGGRSRQSPKTSLQRLNALELWVLQQLSPPAETAQTVAFHPPSQGPSASIPQSVWLSIERLLRHYAQHHFERPIQSAALIDTCFSAEF